MKHSLRMLIANISLFFVSLIICFVIGEIGIRLLNLTYAGHASRVLMFSEDAFQLDSNGAVRYAPNKRIRTVAVYDGNIEYDVVFDTNNLGFVDSKDYIDEASLDKKYYAFVGDSFTAGFHGGEAWVPKLNNRLNSNDVQIYNLGVSGTGFEHFYRLLESAITQVRITHIVVLAISDDMNRRFWYPSSDTSSIRFCDENMSRTVCNERKPIAQIIKADSTYEDILKVSNDFESDISKSQSTIRQFLKQSKLLVFVARAVKDLLREEHQGNIDISLESLKEIRGKFPSAEIHFVHLPQKQEVSKGNYSIAHIGSRISDIGIRYFPALEECQWSDNMFYYLDSHPNKLGYENIAECVSNYLFTRENWQESSYQP